MKADVIIVRLVNAQLLNFFAGQSDYERSVLFMLDRVVG